MDLPEDIYNKKVLNLDAKSVWCKPDIDPNFYNTGFKVFNVSEDEKAIIEKIIVDYGFIEDRDG